MNHDEPTRSTSWTILQTPTGSGKSQGTAVYASMLARCDRSRHPGMLIVTRLIADADEMAKTINDLAGHDAYAFSYHSGKSNSETLETPQNYPVLIITHRAYELAFDRLGHGESNRQTWPFFHAWQGKDRKLVVIDEALDIVEESLVDLDGLRLTLGAIPQELRERFPDEVEAIAETVTLLEKIAEESNDSREAVLSNRMIESGSVVDLSPLRLAMKEVRHDLLQLGYADLNANRSSLKTHDDRLRSFQNICRSWNYYAKVPIRGHSINAARLLVPHGVKGAVVLDATASANVMYDLFDMAEVAKAPVGVRSYKNVTLHVSRGHSVGKLELRRHGDALLTPVMDDLNTKLSGRSVLVVTHHDIKAKVLARQTEFTMKVGHWGAIDGSNEWKDCDAALIFGLRSRPSTWSANTFFALQGVRDTDWLRNKDRPYAGYDDIRSALRVGQTITEVVQAINRIRCRKVIDAEGNCPTADIYILLPNGFQGDRILDGITDLMEGICVRPWELKGLPEKTKKRGRPGASGNAQTALMSFLKNIPSGSFSVLMLKEELAVSDSSIKRFIVDTKDPATDVAKTLATYGVSYMTDGFGRGAKSYFLKQ